METHSCGKFVDILARHGYLLRPGFVVSEGDHTVSNLKTKCQNFTTFQEKERIRNEVKWDMKMPAGVLTVSDSRIERGVI